MDFLYIYLAVCAWSFIHFTENLFCPNWEFIDRDGRKLIVVFKMTILPLRKCYPVKPAAGKWWPPNTRPCICAFLASIHWSIAHSCLFWQTLKDRKSATLRRSADLPGFRFLNCSDNVLFSGGRQGWTHWQFSISDRSSLRKCSFLIDGSIKMSLNGKQPQDLLMPNHIKNFPSTFFGSEIMLTPFQGFWKWKRMYPASMQQRKLHHLQSCNTDSFAQLLFCC